MSPIGEIIVQCLACARAAGYRERNAHEVSAMIATRFAVATHILLVLSVAGHGEAPVTSLRLAASIDTNPVVVRRITGKLGRAGLIRTRLGPGGAGLARAPEAITLADIWDAVHADDAPRPLVPLHAAAGRDAAGLLGAGRIRAALGEAFCDVEEAFRGALAAMTLADLVRRTQDAG
jgi:DNA-binding IscR family transcriptional regulator